MDRSRAPPVPHSPADAGDSSQPGRQCPQSYRRPPLHTSSSPPRLRGSRAPAHSRDRAHRHTIRCRSGKKIDVLAVRFFGTACGPAENSGRAYADVKDSFKARVALYQRTIHCFRRRKKFERLHAEKLALTTVDASTKFEQQIL